MLTQRLLTLDQGPEDTVAGGAPLVIGTRPPEQRLIDAKTLDAAVEYGALTGSHALIVFHRGAVELEHYTSVNPLLLGIIIERATGMRYSEYLSKALW